MRRRSLAVSLVALCACESSPTALRIRLEFGAWDLTQFEIRVEDDVWYAPERSSPDPLPTGFRVAILLTDERAGGPVRVDVWGLAGGERVAWGSVELTPVPGETVDGEISLSRLPCGAFCHPNARECDGDGVRACEEDAEGCRAWRAVMDCAGGTECAIGSCLDECVDECVTGARCDGPAAVRACGENDSDSCADWGPAEPCPAGQTCSLGRCAASCLDECGPDESACLGDGVVRCGQSDADDCLEWGPAEPCPAGQTCSLGRCSEQCEDDCENDECSAGSPSIWRPCGQLDLDPCADAGLPVRCD